jgi:hypothetical protein
VRRPAASEVEEQLRCQPLGQLAQLRVGGAGEVGEQRERLVRVVDEALLDSRFVELADVR